MLRLRSSFGIVAGLGAGMLPVFAATAQTSAPASVEAVTAELEQARAELQAQRRALEAQERRLRALELRLGSAGQNNAPGATSAAPQNVAERTASSEGPQTGAAVDQTPVEQVGEGPVEVALPAVAVLGEMGSVVTRAGQLTAETSFEYARADRNRALFRGIEIVESVLIGVFDINESRQDVLTAAAGLRYGLSDRFELGVRVPFVHRTDRSILTPVAGNNNMTDRESNSAKGDDLGDVELSARYQLLTARPGFPFLIANLQAVAPTGSDPFRVRRDADGRALEAATGAGFWSLSSSLTAILPSDPAVLFGTLGYSYNFAENVNTAIGDVIIERVEPGQALSASLGIGVSLNQRTSFNLGYAHSWVFGTETRTRLRNDDNNIGPMTSTSRDLQLGRLLFGVSYRLDNQASLNWSVEVGATEDATDLRTVVRLPIVL